MSPARSGAVLLCAAACLGAAQLAPAHEPADPGPPAGAADPLPEGSVARVAPKLIAQSLYDHWFRAYVAQKGGKTPKEGTKEHARVRKGTMQFLISARWLELESAEHGVKVSKSELTKAFTEQKREAFAGDEKAYRTFLKRSKRSEKDLRWQVRLSLLTRKLEKHVTAGAKTSSAKKEALKRFVDAFERKWRARTVCAEGYRTGQCSKQPAPTQQPPPSSPPPYSNPV